MGSHLLKNIRMLVKRLINLHVPFNIMCTGFGNACDAVRLLISG